MSVVPEERVAVEVHLGVESDHVAVAGDQQRVDLRQRGVGSHIGLCQVGDQLLRLAPRLAFELQAVGDGAGLERQQTEMRIEVLADDSVGIVLRDLFDVHAALERGHDHRLAGTAIESDRQVELAIDVDGFLDQQLAHLLAIGAGLVGDQLHAEDLTGQLASLFRRTGELHSAALAAAAGMDLRLDDAASAELSADLRHVGSVGGEPALRGGHPVRA